MGGGFDDPVDRKKLGTPDFKDLEINRYMGGGTTTITDRNYMSRYPSFYVFLRRYIALLLRDFHAVSFF